MLNIKDLPKDFDWEFYLESNQDLTNAGIKTEKGAINHYLEHGYKENRVYKSLNEKVLTELEIVMYDFLVDNKNYEIKKEQKFKKNKNVELKKLSFTIVTNNHLSHAISLGDSLTFHNPDHKFIIFLVDEISKNIKLDYEIIQISDISVPNINELVLNYKIDEFCFSLKPYCFYHIFKNYSFEDVTYFDSDILIYDSFDELYSMSKKYDIILTPHIFTPYNDKLRPSENDILNSGIYNLGFIYLKKNKNVFNFLKWWSNKLQKGCKTDLSNGFFVNQLWINHAPIFFNNVGVIQNKGYNVAYWNLHEREISKIDNKFKINFDETLVFFHYSGYKLDEKMSVHSNRFSFKTRPDLIELFYIYKKTLLSNDNLTFKTISPKPKLPNNNDGFNLCGYTNGTFGLGKANRDVINIFEQLSINYNINELIANNHGYNLYYETTEINNYKKNIIILNPEDKIITELGESYIDKKYNIGVWFWELSKLPKNWKKNSIYFSEVWAPTKFLYDNYREELDKSINVKLVKFPVEEIEILSKKESKNKFNIKEDEFVCLFIFDYFSDFYRKNPDGVVKSFKRAFKNKENVKLIIKSQNGTKEQIEEFKKLILDDNRIILINERYSYEKIKILMNSCDVYISLHRSEGLGLTLLESILLEKPTVCTNYSGNVDFCLPDWSELVEFRLVKVDEKSIYYRMIGENEDIYWAEPDIDDASKKLYKVYNNLNEYEKRAKEGKKWILENYDIKNISNIINDTINK